MKKAIGLSILSGILLMLAFPNTSGGWLAWFALVPLLSAIHGAQKISQALCCGFVTGLVFFGGSMHWLTHVTFVGWILLVLMESVYVMLFAVLAYLAKKFFLSMLTKILWVVLAWTVTEFLRSEMPIFGLGWNLLAYSQSDSVMLIQFANLLGAYGLGFVMMFVNGCVWGILDPAIKKQRGISAALFSGICLIIFGLLLYGKWSLTEKKKPEEFLRVAVLQGNIPQSVKWELMAKDKILEIYEKLAQLASLNQPDLILWPEASFPGYFNRDVQSERITKLAQEIQTPLLIGALEWESQVAAYNSAYFLDKNGVRTQRYDKRRLVPFGEYIPLKLFFGWLDPFAGTLGISDFSAGRDSVIFNWARSEWPFSVLICFEDVFTDLARTDVNHGAKFLAVITNDAWFGNSSAPFQHLQASIFRAVENGVAVVRAANTGVSAFISHQGEVLAYVQNENEQKTFLMGQKIQDLPLIQRETFYRQGGWMFPYFAAVIFLCLGIILWARRTSS